MDSVKVRQMLKHSGFISDVFCFDEISSTNSFLSSNEIPVNSFAISEYQTKGKGRLERSWDAAKYLNLTFSFKKKIQSLPF